MNCIRILLGVLLACAGNWATGAARPNVLFIAADDLGNVLGANRPAGLKTPNLDHLAARGVYFERAYCQVPLCNPSRASVLTGRRPDATGVFDLERHFRKSLPEVVTLPQLFRNSGWHTARIGKIFHYNVPNGIGTDGLDDPESWDHVINPRGRDVLEEKQIVNPTPGKPVSAALSWLAAEGSDEEQTDGMIATGAIRLLEENRGRPFFLGVGFFRPHTPYVAPKRYFEMYPLETVSLSRVLAGDRDDIPASAFPHNCTVADYGLSREACREALRAYYASTSFMDAQLGRVLEALDRLGLARNTVIVFWSDHGYHLGEHGLWQKRSLFDESARAPLIIAWPEGRAHGIPCRRVVEFVDIYPTVADLAGLKPAPNLAGRSLRPLLDQPDAPWMETAFTQILRPGTQEPVMGCALTTARWRYIEWDEGRAGRELYDHTVDASEIHNRATDPANRAVVEELRGLLHQKVKSRAAENTFNRERL
jgi:iduronate 2-sulfatase